ncbi:hypothetical protein D3C85_1656470 [compost metagenome]
MVARQDQAAGQQHEQPLHIAQHTLPAHAGSRDHQRGQPFNDEENGEGVQREVQRVVQRIDENEDARDQKKQPGREQAFPSLAQIGNSQQKQYKLWHACVPVQEGGN